MWEPATLPYTNPNSTVHLPTTGEILACTNVLHESFFDRKLVAINDQIVVKFGRVDNSHEGQALIYLEKYVPDVHAPRLYAMYWDADQFFLVMSKVPGVQLEGLWTSLSDGEKDSVTSELRRMFEELRRVEFPWPDFFGSVDGGGVRHDLFVAVMKMFHKDVNGY